MDQDKGVAIINSLYPKAKKDKNTPFWKGAISFGSSLLVQVLPSWKIQGMLNQSNQHFSKHLDK